MWIFLVFTMLISTLIAHGIWVRIGHSSSQVFCFLCVGVPIGIIHVSLSFLIFGQSEKAISSILVYAASCQLILYLLSLAANGVSISILDQIGKDINNSDLLGSEYSTSVMVLRRIKQLQLDGFLIKHNDKLQLTYKGQMLVKSFLKLRLFFGHEIFPSNLKLVTSHIITDESFNIKNSSLN